jgi:hypothetical protein
MSGVFQNIDPIPFHLTSVSTTVSREDSCAKKEYTLAGLKGGGGQYLGRRQIQIKIHAEPYWKRFMPELAIGEIKTRMAIRLKFQSNTPDPWTPLHKLKILLFRLRIKQVEG